MNRAIVQSVPMVSVIIPCYNSAAYVGQAISSALASEGVTTEVIVIDDGSTDGSWQVLESFGERIRKIRQDRGGPYKARNLGAQLANGEWLAFLDADDDWLPGKLAAQLTLADEATALVYTDRLNFGDLSSVKERQSDSVTLWDGDVFEPLLQGNFITLSSVLMRKSWFDKVGGFSVERRGVQDWDMWLRCAAEGGSVRLCRDALTRYRIHADQMTNDVGQRAADREDVLRRALATKRGRSASPKVVELAYASLWELAAWHAATSGELWRSLRYQVRAASYSPLNPRIYKGLLKYAVGRV